MNTVAVLKFGGSSFAEPGDYAAVAQHVADRVATAGKAVVVVSARPGETERLRSLAHHLNGSPSSEAIDGLLPLADTVNAGLVKVALDRAQVRARVLTGHQMGFLTDSNFGNARLLSIQPTALREALTDVDVVLLPGGQSVDAGGRPTWMGKNSSDLSAVAVAAALGASEVELYSDVDGVYTGDPHLLTGTRRVDRISHEQVAALAQRGAKVLHLRSVRLAQRHGVRIVCRLNRPPFAVGTLIGAEEGTYCGVVVASRSIVVRFVRPDEAERSYGEIAARGIDALLLDEAVALPTGFVDILDVLASADLEGDVTDEKIVSVICADSIESHLAADSAAAVRLGQHLHDQFLIRDEPPDRLLAPVTHINDRSTS